MRYYKKREFCDPIRLGNSILNSVTQVSLFGFMGACGHQCILVHFLEVDLLHGPSSATSIPCGIWETLPYRVCSEKQFQGVFWVHNLI